MYMKRIAILEMYIRLVAVKIILLALFVLYLILHSIELWYPWEKAVELPCLTRSFQHF